MKNHEAELYKDKIEVSLDGRQIFYLFFGGAVIASMVFVLGVMIGKRLESRAHVRAQAQTSASDDPLAALDKLSSTRPGLAFPAALTQDGEGPLAKVDRVIAARAAVAPGNVKASVPAKPAEVAKPAPKPVVAAKPAPPVEKKPAPAAKPEKAPAKPTREPAKAVADADDKTASSDEEKPNLYTLQLSSFRDRSEANAFHTKLTSAGYSAYVVEATVKGEPWFRVRLGRYPNYGEAIAAKGSFERKQKIIAYVTRLK